MKRLSTLALLIGALLTPVLHSEETTGDISFPSPLADAAPSAASSDAPPAMPPVQDDTTPPLGGLVPSMVSGLTLSQMGMPEGVILSGGQLQGGADFTLPGDQVVTMAQLMLDVKVSPEMAARNATLQLMLNGQPLGTVPLGAAENDISHYQLDIPAALMVSSNNLSFKINDGDAQQCLRDLTDKYRVVILPTSRFNWEG